MRTFRNFLNRKNCFNRVNVRSNRVDLEINEIYNKHHLVPFGEYMPLGFDTITGVSNFRSGPIPENIELTGRQFQFLPLICYEIIFSSYANNTNPDAAILNITNDEIKPSDHPIK